MLNSVTRYGDNLLDFYNLPKSVLCRMAGNHFVTSHQGSSGFSSWAASLHLVLSYAKFLKKHNRGEPHAAVMDTHDLADEVYVWHAPHIVCETHGTLEYIAFGRIMGNGYRAVSLTVSEDHGIDFLFPRVRNGRHTKFGRFRRQVWVRSWWLNRPSATSLSMSPRLWPASGLGYGETGGNRAVDTWYGPIWRETSPGSGTS
jgi:hypothetical protein